MAVEDGWGKAISENISNEFIEDLVAQPLGSGAEYISDSVINHKKFTMTGLMTANTASVFSALLPGSTRLAVRLSVPTRSTVSTAAHPQLHRFARHLGEAPREAAWSAAGNVTRDCLSSLMDHEDISPSTIIQNGAETTGESINAGFSGAHAENWTVPHLHHTGR